MLALIAQRVRQCADDRFAVAHERLAGRGFQRAMSEQREQSRNEQAIRGAHFARAANRFLHDEGIMVVEQRHEQRRGIADRRCARARSRLRRVRPAAVSRTSAIDLLERCLGRHHSS